jgi:hypothetical protein
MLPKQTLPRTRFTAVDLDGVRALRIEAQGSYGNLLHELPAGARAGRQLSWRWRVERFAAGTDLRQKAGDDTAAKVCLMFDMPLDRVPFLERQTLRMARAAASEDLPAATLCYVWDAGRCGQRQHRRPQPRLPRRPGAGGQPLKHLLLLGGWPRPCARAAGAGRAAAARGADVTLVTPFARQMYSGMVPGLVAGHYAVDQCAIPLRPLAQAAGVR